VIPCFDIEHRLPYIFKSSSAKEEREFDFLMRNVALAASASPTLFYPVRIPRERASGRSICLVDGGVFANNPAICALSEINSMFPSKNNKYFVVSLGTGKSTRPLSEAFISLWGYVQWSRPMLEVVMESISESVHEQIQHLLPHTDEQQYYRLQIELPERSKHAIDNASKSNMEIITHAALDFCSDRQNGPEIDRLCKTLLRLSEEKQVEVRT
jgi:patatin-like phospholipase/acyl hydrolase